MTAAFYIAAAVAALATLLVVTRAHAVHALLYFVVSLFALAVVFFVLGAPFAAALEVIVYAGAIMVLFLFVVMLVDVRPGGVARERAWLRGRFWRGPALLALVLVAELVWFVAADPLPERGGGAVPPAAVGRTLFGPYVVGVEIASFLLLAGLVGAYRLARPAPRSAPRPASRPARGSAPGGGAP